MLSSKYVAIHGMKNEKWNAREKILQYRTVLKLHARDKRLQAINAQKLKKNVSKNLKQLNSDIREYRSIVKDVVYGDKRLLRSILQDQKDFQLLLQDAKPLEAYRTIFQDYNMKRKQLDKLVHSKEKTMKNFCILRSEHAELTEEFEQLREVTQVEEEQQKQQQQLLTRYQGAMARHHAAKSIGEMYRDMVVILKKDSMYFDGVLNALRSDQRDQSRVIFKTTLIGQLAAENLDDIRQKYKKIARDVWIAMKEREQALEITRRRAEDIWEYAKSLVRVESDGNLRKRKLSRSYNIDRRLEKQIGEFENIFNIIKKSLLIRSYEELFIRLDEQTKQRERLLELYKRYIKTRETMLTKKNHGELMLENLEHSSLSTTTQYTAEKEAILAKLKEVKKREADSKSMIQYRGELLMNIRAALQNMSAVLVCVKAGRPSGKGKEAKRALKEEEAKEKAEAEIVVHKDDKKNKGPCEDNIETEGLTVLTQVTRKAMALFGLTNYPLDRAGNRRAREAYQNYLADFRAKMKFRGDGEYHTGMYFEHEAVSTGILTRVEMKIKSKQIVEAHSQLD